MRIKTTHREFVEHPAGLPQAFHRQVYRGVVHFDKTTPFLLRHTGAADFQGHRERVEEDDFAAQLPTELRLDIPAGKKIQRRRQQ